MYKRQDPELLTVKALRVMKQCPVIAIPVSDKNFTEAAYDPTGTDPAYKSYLEKCVAYQIAVQADAQIGEKAKLYLPMPMMKEKERLRQVHDEGAEKTAELLEKGMDFLRKFAERVSPGKELHIIGPAWASVGKVNDVYRKVLYLKHSQESVLLDIKNKFEKYIEINSGFRKLYIQYDYI